MLLAVVISNLIWTLPLCIGFGLIGYLMRSAVLKKMHKRVHQLEAEMLQNHAEILALQKENTELAERLKNNPNAPVIPITGAAPKETPSENLPDVAARKKLLGTSAKKS